jgi:hypothetical protein
VLSLTAAMNVTIIYVKSVKQQDIASEAGVRVFRKGVHFFLSSMSQPSSKQLDNFLLSAGIKWPKRKLITYLLLALM